ncbi:MAG TPA: sugar phosphate isomerase/epimerase [Tepidisphaeraceae bacterium]|nr:sugar phosphate isomerase/epimerase [Tepidisphaeraceae bacterium]
MLTLGAFADEISPDFDEQTRVCRANGVTLVELRGAYSKNVLDFDLETRRAIKIKLAEAKMGVVSIGSPVGKVAIDQPWEEHFARFKIAVDAALFFNAPLIRVFSYYPPGGEGAGAIAPHRDEVIARFKMKVDYITDLPVTLVHENEKGIYGDTGTRCVDLMQAINSPKLRTAFDFANFVQCGEDPLAIWPQLKPFTTHIHIKDAVKGTGRVVPAGQGDGQLLPILKDAYASGYRGCLSLEPHLKVAGHSHGETGESLFNVAADALKAVCQQAGIPLTTTRV